MNQIRYIILIVIVVASAAVAVLWQNRKTEDPAITFTRPVANDFDIPESVQPDVEVESPSIVPLKDPLAGGSEVVVADTPSPLGGTRDEPLSEEQIAAQIALAQTKLAQLEQLNARKQALVDQELAAQQDAEQPLLEAEIAYHIGGWRQAWRTGNVDRYFSYYSRDFTPNNGVSVAQWRSQRVKRLDPSKPISLELEDFSVTYDAESRRSLVRFTQAYRSGEYQDRVRKKLVMVKEQGGWKILSEIAE